MESGGSMPHSQGLSNNSYPVPNQPITRIDTYLFKVHSNIIFPSTPRPPERLLLLFLLKLLLLLIKHPEANIWTQDECK